MTAKTIYGVDCATPLTKKTAEGIKAAGYAFAGRYLVPAEGSLRWKALTKEECKVITDAGLSILTVWETTADRTKGGMAAGAEDGARAVRLAESCDVPSGAAIYFAVDYDAPKRDYDVIEGYLSGAKAQLGDKYRVGVYGSHGVIEAMAKRGAAECFWQCVAWSYGRKSKHRSVYQALFGQCCAGVSVDINECDDLAAAGIWSYADKSNEEDDDMTGEQIYNALKEYLAGKPVPAWARDELQEAIDMGITDGTRPMELVPRYQAAIMAKRAAKAAAK